MSNLNNKKENSSYLGLLNKGNNKYSKRISIKNIGFGKGTIQITKFTGIQKAPPHNANIVKKDS